MKRSPYSAYDVLSTGSATAALRRWLSYDQWDATAKVSVQRMRLAGLPAASAEINAQERRAFRLAAYRDDHQTQIVNHLDLDTDAAHAVQDGVVFPAVLRGFSLPPLPD